MKRAPLTMIALLAATMLAATVKAESAAELLSADTAVFIEIDDIAKHRAAMENDPIGSVLLEKQREAMDQNNVWLAIQAAMGMTGDEIIDTYFGKKLVVVGKEAGENKPAYVLSKISDADGAAAVENLQLVSSNMTAGDFKIYNSEDGQGFFALGKGWLAMTGWEHVDFMKSSLEKLGKGSSLAKTAEYKKFVGQLPKSRFATLFAHDTVKGETHALGATNSATKLSLFYRGHSPEFANVFTKLGEATSFNFGPLPKSTVAAASLNLFERNPPADIARIDQFFGENKSFTNDILPKIEAPIVVFLGELPGDEADPKTEFRVPVLGIAIKMKDKSVAEDLNVGMNNALAFGNIGIMGLGGKFAAIQSTEYNGVPYRTVNFGAGLAVPAQRDEVKSLVRATYGAVGDWFVVCTQSKFFEQCVDAKTGDFSSIEPGTTMTPIMAGRINGSMLARHLGSWLTYGETADLPRFNEIPVKELKEVLELAKHIQAVDLQVHRGEDDIVVGQVDVQRK